MKDIKLKENERIISVVRRYGLTLFWHWFLGVLLITTAFFFMFWLFGRGWLGQGLFGLLMASGVLVFFRTYFLWKRNALVITTHRVVDVDQSGFLEREVSEMPYDQIEDVYGKISGFFGTMFRYGLVSLQTGNGKVVVLVDKVKNPTHTQQIINEFRGRYVSKYAHDFSGDVAGVIIDKLYELEPRDLMRIEKAIRKRLDKPGSG